MKIKQTITLIIILISATVSFAQSTDLDKDITEINILMKENGINNKYYTQLSVSDDKLIFENVGSQYKLKNTQKREITIEKIVLKKIKLTSTNRHNRTLTSTIEIKTKGKHIYNDALKGNYSNCFIFLKVKKEEVAETVQNKIIELITKLQA
ncbi:hypothetical protein [Olleya namhaensis]|uniref:DUF4468 domain-containing protein n=1 Tax=Olleya namhaensis TaxID=1144750 RepID=A0A1I3S2X1_9FLAO|nr:hypothetical protein [Olleya namhaensis]SFJ52958.1 hypothetical protein SAMN05443431_1096 [Olleya namhaensis]